MAYAHEWIESISLAHWYMVLNELTNFSKRSVSTFMNRIVTIDFSTHFKAVS